MKVQKAIEKTIEFIESQKDYVTSNIAIGLAPTTDGEDLEVVPIEMSSIKVDITLVNEDIQDEKDSMANRPLDLRKDDTSKKLPKKK